MLVKLPVTCHNVNCSLLLSIATSKAEKDSGEQREGNCQGVHVPIASSLQSYLRFCSPQNHGRISANGDLGGECVPSSLMYSVFKISAFSVTDGCVSFFLCISEPTHL